MIVHVVEADAPQGFAPEPKPPKQPLAQSNGQHENAGDSKEEVKGGHLDGFGWEKSYMLHSK